MKDKDLPEKLLISGFMCFLITVGMVLGVGGAVISTMIFMADLEELPTKAELADGCPNLEKWYLSHYIDDCINNPEGFFYEMRNLAGSIVLGIGLLFGSVLLIMPYLFKKDMGITFLQLISARYDLKKAIKYSK